MRSPRELLASTTRASLRGAAALRLTLPVRLAVPAFPFAERLPLWLFQVDPAEGFAERAPLEGRDVPFAGLDAFTGLDPFAGLAPFAGRDPMAGLAPLVTCAP